jgi:hypothetical protein
MKLDVFWGTQGESVIVAGRGVAASHAQAGRDVGT